MTISTKSYRKLNYAQTPKGQQGDNDAQGPRITCIQGDIRCVQIIQQKNVPIV